ncbi:META domain-containing protein [Corynebacterium sp. p3-SID1194]|uniref:META domain-containing protein n=2 Tax=Corynebacterium TaxID=1716 RepID=UPI0021A3BE95|nr:META domain-containing protein [Corynebacterium sp. p3-SID1194]MCT1450690.1 META domain-containing protein [Corynebacterium sp. p3-SID1194]
MVSKTLATVKKMTVATAAVAIAGGALGAGTAGAQELSSTSEIKDRATQLSSTLQGPKNDAGKGQDSTLIVDLPQGSNHLDPVKAKAALTGPLKAKNNENISLEFTPSGTPDGTLSYDDGCNAGNANYHFDSADNLRISDFAETLALCEGAGAADADALKTILQANPAVYQIDDNTVALASQGKAIEFVKAEASQEN